MWLGQEGWQQASKQTVGSRTLGRRSLWVHMFHTPTAIEGTWPPNLCCLRLDEARPDSDVRLHMNFFLPLASFLCLCHCTMCQYAFICIVLVLRYAVCVCVCVCVCVFCKFVCAVLANCVCIPFVLFPSVKISVCQDCAHILRMRLKFDAMCCGFLLCLSIRHLWGGGRATGSAEQSRPSL